MLKPTENTLYVENKCQGCALGIENLLRVISDVKRPFFYNIFLHNFAWHLIFKVSVICIQIAGGIFKLTSGYFF